jgi:uncharacterized membrane protein
MKHKFNEFTKNITRSPTRRVALKKFGIYVAGMALACFGLVNSASAGGPSFTTFDFPGAIFTDGVGINGTGDIVGHYIDASGVDHGYLLHKGKFTTVDFPGSDGGHVHGINDANDIVGLYIVGNKYHGFLLSRGKYTAIKFPDARNTRANGINSAGDIVGTYVEKKNDPIDGNNDGKTHGFLLRGGIFRTIDFPDAHYTEAWRINDCGQVVGRYKKNGNFHVFLLNLASGEFTSIDFPGASETAGGDFTQMGGLNNHGDIASGYCNAGNCELDSVGAIHGFLLKRDSFTSLDVPGAAATIAFGMNDHDQIVGGYTDANLQVHAFLRTP